MTYSIMQVAGTWWLLRTENDGTTYQDGAFNDRPYAERTRDLLNRHGLTDTPLPDNLLDEPKEPNR